MTTPSINIGLCNKGKELISCIDNHFELHEVELYQSILSSSITLNNEKLLYEIFNKDAQRSESDLEYLETWFEDDINSKINNLRQITSGSVGETTIVNVVLQIDEIQATDILKNLLNAINRLTNDERIGILSVKLFVVVHPFIEKNSHSNQKISEQLKVLNEIIIGFDEILHDVFFIDNQNIDKLHLNLDYNWLSFALGEFFVFQMIGPTSLALTDKNKIFGLGVVHFNEVLFREIISKKILAYKFEEEGIDDSEGVQIQDVFDKCNPFIKNHQDFFDNFFKKYPYSSDTDGNIGENTKAYVLEFKKSLDFFVTDKHYKIGETKVILANLLGEDDDKIEGVDWRSERLNLKDLEFDIVNYFNQFLEDEEKVDLNKIKGLREQITDLKNGIKKDRRTIKTIDDRSDDISKDLNISFEEGTFSVNGKRINASGYIPSIIKPEDEFYEFKDEIIPERIDLSPYFNSVKDQGELSSCTAFTISAVYEFAANQNNKNVNVSELFVYYNSRVIRGSVKEDSGASLLDAVNAVKDNGACLSKSHPYDISKFNKKPSKNSFIEAKHQIVEKAYRLNINEKEFKQSIANGYPVIFGLKLFESFYPKNKSGLITHPTSKEKLNKNHGNHAMLLVGYNDEEKLFKVRNSWGSSFGIDGYCYIPYDYVTDTNFCNEAFIITNIIDLSYSEFEYDSNASFSFLKDALVRKKNITAYRLRNRVKKLSTLKKEYEITVLQNDENKEQIKNSNFRKNLLNKIKNRPKEPIIESPPPPPQIKENKKKWYTMLVAGIFCLILIFIIPAIFIGKLILGSIGLILIIWSLLKIFNKEKRPIPIPSRILQPIETPVSNYEYKFRVADRLFDRFDELDKDLIIRYQALSKYFNYVNIWKEENIVELENVNFESPSFVINVVEKKPLMDYLSANKSKFLKHLPHLSFLFHENFETETKNVDEVFQELKGSYLDKIKIEIDDILEVSIINYLLGKKYLYFNKAPKLDETISNLEKVSRPFCNLKSANSISIKTQHYTLMEKIETNEDNKLDQLKVHQKANINPIIVNRENNKKKYVSIQIAGLMDVENLVKFGSN